MATMNRTRRRVVKDEPELPKATFAECDYSQCWDTDADQPIPLGMEELEDPEVAEWADSYIAAWEAWRKVQIDPAEAGARAAYAERAARHLVGVFPNCRVNADAYATAAGEEMGRFSADVTRSVAQFVRRSSKALPTLAQLIETAERECGRRDRLVQVYIAAKRAHSAAVRKGQEEAQGIAAKAAAAGIAPPISAEDVLRFYEVATLYPLNVKVDNPGWVDRAAKVALTRLGQGDGAVSRLAAALIANQADSITRAEAAPDKATMWDVYNECDVKRRALLDELGAIIGMPRGPSDRLV